MLDRSEVDEVACFGTPKHCEDLVNRELLAGASRGEPAAFRGEEPGVGAQVEFGAVLAALDDQSREAGVRLDAGARRVPPRAARDRQRVQDGRHLPRETEEVEVSRLSLDLTAHDERGAAGKREVLRVSETGDDRRDLLL